MTPFAIQCGSCGARLRVRKSSSIGQTLACPKCKHAIKVVPPPDWVDEETPNAAGSSAPATSRAANPRQVAQEKARDAAANEGLGANFDDLDRLLADVEHASLEQLADLGAPPTTATPSVSTPQFVQVEESSAATLPNDEWVSASTKGRRQLLTIVSLAIAGIVLSGLLIIYLVYQMGRSANSVAQGDTKSAQQTDSNPGDQDTPGPADDEQSPRINPADNGTSEDTDTSPDDPSSEDAPSDDQSANGSVTGDSVKGDSVAGDNSTGDNADNGADTPRPGPENDTTTDPTDDVTPQDTSPTPQTTDPNDSGKIADQPPGFTAEPDRQRGGILNDPILGGLEDLEDFSIDTGSGEAREALDAHRRNDEWMLADADAPFIELPRPREVDLARQLNAPLIGFRSEKMPLFRYLEITSTLIGAPISLTPEAIEMEGISHTTELDVNAVEQTFGNALSDQLTPLGLTYDVLENSIRVRPQSATDELSEATYDVEALASGFPQGFSDLQFVIESLIEPASWQGEETDSGPSIARQGDQMVVRQTVGVQRRLERFLMLLRHVRGLATDDSAADIKTQLTPYSMADACLQEPATYEMHQPRRLGDVVLRLIENQGVDIVIDWEGLIAEGWTMDTELPLVVVDGTFADVLRRLCGTLGISFRVLGPRQFELLTRSRAFQETECGLFDLSDLIDQGVRIDSIANQIQAAFPSRDARFSNRFYFDATSGYLLTRLSQDDQRALHRFLVAWQRTTAARGR